LKGVGGMDMNPTNGYEIARGKLELIHKHGFGRYTPNKSYGGILRPQQLQALNKIIYATFHLKAKYIVLSAPTGCGKSLIAKVYARVMHETRNFSSNITTSNRELQKQYGRDLEGDETCKVIMGTANYRCTLFKDVDKEDGVLKSTPVSQAPCQDDKSDLEKYWGSVKVAEKRHEHEVETIHEDQDYDVLSSAGVARSAVEVAVKALERANEKLPPNEPALKFKAWGLKKVCRDGGSCSYINARQIAEMAPTAIRSLQHLIFYILFKVGKPIPILQARQVHIIDEFHTVETIFRDFLSVHINEIGYRDVINKADTRDLKEKQKDPYYFTSSFKDHKKNKGDNKWSAEDSFKLAVALENELADFIERFFLPSENEVRRLFGKQPVTRAREYIQAAVKGELEVGVDDLKQPKQAIVKWYTNLARFTFDRAMTKNTEYGICVKQDARNAELNVFPVYLDKAKAFLGTEHTLMMSATPIPKVVLEKMFKLKDEIIYIEVPSDFPPERSPIFFSPVAKITEQNARDIGKLKTEGRTFSTPYAKDMASSAEGWDELDEKLSDEIREIANHFPSVSGIVPCNSYKRVMGLKKYLGEHKRFIWVTIGTEAKAKVLEFRERVERGDCPILVSASISEGHSFDDDISRLQIIPKMPFPSIDESMDLLMKAYRKPYYQSKTVATIQQMCGRSMRSKEDYCITVILDQKFDVIKDSAHSSLCTRHFLECIRWDGDWRNYQTPD